MRSKHRLFTRAMALMLMLALLLAGCGQQEAAQPTLPPETTEAITEAPTEAPETTAATEATEPAPTEALSDKVDALSVAIYPYVPDPELFMDILRKQWAEIEPDIALEFVDWDCYHGASPEGIDVIMFDAIFTTYLVEKGYVQPIDRSDIQDEEGIVPVALEGIVHDGEVYGIPYLLCSYFLMHREDDAELSAVDNFEDLYDVISGRMDQEESGLVSNFSSNYVSLYLDVLMDQANAYTQYEVAPDAANPSEEAMEMLRKIYAITADCREWEGTFNTFSRASHFNAGVGDAYYGFSEDMAFMGDILDEISIRCISFSDEGNIPLFYTDIAAMGSHVTDSAHKEACLKLMNLVSSEAFLQEACFGTTDTVQYLLPARENLYTVAAQTYPVYGRLHELVMNEDNRLCRFGRDIWKYFTEAANYLPGWLY